MRRSPTYIHERPTWPDFSWDTDALATPLAAARHSQGRLLGRMESLGFDLCTSRREPDPSSPATSSSPRQSKVKSSTQQEVRSSILVELGIDAAGLPRAGREVEGVVEMMLDATRRFAAPLSRERLFGWHASLFPTGRSGMHRITVGAWRTKESGAMQVISGPLGREKVHFEAPAADRLETEMARFIDWFNAPSGTDPVLRAGIAHFWFVTIHPFEDGNGRIARAIADMALARTA